MNSKAIALLTLQPNEEQIDFFNGFNEIGYDVVTIVDDKNFTFEQSKIKIVHIDDARCKEMGFKHLNAEITLQKNVPCTAWERALFYFTHVNINHKYVWFIEDDVFIPSHHTLTQIDGKYDCDVVSGTVHSDADLKTWDWWATVPSERLPPPWRHGMVCAIRLSSVILNEIGNFLYLNRKFEASTSPRKCFFIEFLFHTIAHRKKLSAVTAPELDGILWRMDWNMQHIRDGFLYHPIKNFQQQAEMRRLIRNERI